MSIAELVALGVDELRRDVPVSDVTGHRARQDALRQATAQLAEWLGVDDAVGGEPSGDALVHETAVFASGPAATCSVEQWRPALADLDVAPSWPEWIMQLESVGCYAQVCGCGPERFADRAFGRAWITHPSMPPLLPRESWRPAERQNRPGQPANSPPRR